MKKSKISPKVMAITALLMAMTVVMSSFSIPVPGGHLYLNDTIISLAALILNPLCAFAAGGIGAFLGDFFFYPTPMFVSLVVHGLQSLVISYCARKTEKKWIIIIALIIGGLINVVGYTLGRAFIYSKPETALIKLPFQFVQGASGAILAPILYYCFGIKKYFDKNPLK